MKDLSNHRISYQKNQLTENQLPQNPIELFAQWFAQADKNPQIIEANAFTITTIGTDSFPKSRIVLLKQFTQDTFRFFTNYNSEKGKAISQNPHVCLSFFWPEEERQVIIKGIAEKSSSKVSDNYFSSRPIGSQLGAMASPQSNIIPDYSFLEKNLALLTQEYQEKTPQRPQHWGGYDVLPISIEFWQGRPNRLHDRILYTKENNVWSTNRLAP